MADATTSRSKSLHHVAYATRDVEATYAFYSGMLGLPLIHCENHRQGDGWFRHFFFDMGGGECLAFFEVSDVGEKPDYSTQISLGLGLPIWVNHLAFRLDTLAELEATTLQLQSRGVQQLREIDHGWCKSLYLVDPNGIMVEFCVTTNAAEFGQSEAEALRLLRTPPEEIPEANRKETSIAKPVG